MILNCIDLTIQVTGNLTYPYMYLICAITIINKSCKIIRKLFVRFIICIKKHVCVDIIIRQSPPINFVPKV